MKIAGEIERIQQECKAFAERYFSQAERWKSFHYVLIAVSIISLCACVVLTFFNLDHKLIAGFVGLSSNFVTIILTFLSPQEKYLFFQSSANEYLALKNEMNIFLKFELPRLSEEEQILALKDFTQKQTKLNEKLIQSQ